MYHAVTHTCHINISTLLFVHYFVTIRLVLILASYQVMTELEQVGF